MLILIGYAHGPSVSKQLFEARWLKNSFEFKLELKQDSYKLNSNLYVKFEIDLKFTLKWNFK